MILACRILCFVGLVVLAYAIFSRPREIVITDQPSETPQVSKPQLQPATRPRPRPGPKPQPADGVTIEPERQQPTFEPLEPKSPQGGATTENQPVFRPLQPKSGQSQSAFAAYDHAARSMQAASGKPVEVWGGGDDALTVRLRDALEDAFRSSADFHLSSGKKPGTLVITLPSNVGWKTVAGRTQVLYMAEFASDGQKLGGSNGSCWGDALAKCAAQIVKDAKGAARHGDIP